MEGYFGFVGVAGITIMIIGGLFLITKVSKEVTQEIKEEEIKEEEIKD